MKKQIHYSLVVFLFIFGIQFSFGQWSDVDTNNFDDFDTGFTQSGFSSQNYGAEVGGTSDKCAYDKNVGSSPTSYVALQYTLDVGFEYRFSYMAKRAQTASCGLTLKYDAATGNSGTSVSAEFTPPKRTGSEAGDRYTSNVITGDGNTYYLKVAVTTGNSSDVKLRVDGFLLEKQAVASGPTVGFDITTSSVAEGNAGTTTHNVVVTMSSVPSADTNVDILSSGNTATEGTDYVAVSSTITFLTTDTYPKTIQVPVTINGDTAVETDEDFYLLLDIAGGSSSDATVGTDTHTVTITNDDSYNQCFTDNDDFEKVAVTTNSDGDVWTYNAGTYSMNGYNGGGSEESNQWLILGDLDLSTYTGSELLQLVLDATEQYSGTDLTVYITDTYTGCPDDAGNSWVSLGTITATGTAQAFDMSVASGSSSVYIGIQYADADGSYSSWDLSNIAIETDNATCFTINAPMASTCVTLPTVGFDVATSSVTEGDAGTTTHNVAVSMDIAPSANTNVDIVSSGNTATEGTDYVAVSSTITFLTTDTYPKTIQVPVTINGDTDFEANEDFDLLLAIDAGNSTGTDATEGTNTHTVTIVNDDIAPVVPCSQLFISEYGEPSSGNGKYLEIYNPTNTPIDLSNYELWKVTNGGTWPEITYALSGTITAFSTYTIANNNTDVPGADEYTRGSIMQFSGDDAIGIAYNGGAGTTFSLIDAIGTDGSDPGSGWDVAGITNGTKDHTLMRKPTIQNPNTDWTASAGTTIADSEWIVVDYNLNNFGMHQSICKCNATTEFISGAWTNGAPNYTTHAIISDQYSTSQGNLKACTCTVNNNGVLFVEPNTFAKVVYDFENNGLTNVRNAGSFVQEYDDATVTGSGTFKVNVTTTPLLDTDRFTYFSSPSTGNNLAIFSWANLAYMWSFDGTTQNWHYEASPASVAMDAAQGFAVQDNNTSDTTNGDQETTIFNGAFNNGVFSQPMYYQVAGAPDPSDSSSALVGNPYPSAIDSDKLFTANPQLAGIYIWNHDSPLGNNYGDWANNDYIVCSAGNACTSAPSGGPNATHSGFIATGQGFFVTANTANPADLVFNNAMRVVGNNDQFHRTPSEDRMWINLTDSTIGYYSQTLFRFTSNGNENLNNQYDALRLGSNYGLSFYSITHDTNDKLAIEDRGLFADDITIPVGYTVNNPAVTQLTFSIDHFQNLEGVNVYLKDNLLNITHDLKLADYTFGISTTGEVNDRFELLFSRNALATTNFEVSKDRLVVSNQGNSQIKVNMLDGSVISNLKAYNTLGKLVINTYANSNSFVINTTLKRGQIVFIKATLENGQILKKKFIKL